MTSAGVYFVQQRDRKNYLLDFIRIGCDGYVKFMTKLFNKIDPKYSDEEIVTNFIKILQETFGEIFIHEVYLGIGVHDICCDYYYLVLFNDFENRFRIDVYKLNGMLNLRFDKKEEKIIISGFDIDKKLLEKHR